MQLKHILTASSIVAMVASPALAENILRWTSQGDALTLDPHSQNESPTIAMNGQLYESLVTRDADLNLQPELAESWSVNADGWTFNLLCSTQPKYHLRSLATKLLVTRQSSWRGVRLSMHIRP